MTDQKTGIQYEIVPQGGSSPEVFGQLPLPERNIYPDADHVYVISNIMDVLNATPNGGEGITGVGAYDGRGMEFLVPRPDQEITFFMDSSTNTRAEVEHYRQMLDQAGIGRDKLHIKVMTKNGLINYDELPEDHSPEELTQEEKGTMIIEEIDENRDQRGSILHPMMATDSILGFDHQEWIDAGVELPTNVLGYDKAVARVMLAEAVRKGETRIDISRGEVIMHPKKFEFAKARFPTVDWNTARRLDSSSLDSEESDMWVIDMDEDREKTIDNVLSRIEGTMSRLGNVVLKHGTGHSGTSNFIMRGEGSYDEDALRTYVAEVIDAEEGENIVIEEFVDMLEDSDGKIEVGVRGGGDSERFQISSLHRQITTGKGIYEGQILAVNGDNLTTANGRFKEGAQRAYEGLGAISEVYARHGYVGGPLNIDFLITGDNPARAMAADLNNTREGGSSASSNTLALAVEAIKQVGIDRVGETITAQGEGIKMMEELSIDGSIDVEELGMYDRDYKIQPINGKIVTPQDWDQMVRSFQEAGILPYSTSTLDHTRKLDPSVDEDSTRKIKLMALFDFRALAGYKDTGRFEYLDQVVVAKAQQILSQYSLELVHSHSDEEDIE